MPDPASGTAKGAAPAPDQGSAADAGRDRLFAALRRPSRGQALVGVLLAVLGFAAVTQVRENDRDQNYVGARQSDLIALINTLSLATDRAETEIAELQRTRDALRDDADSSETALTIARERLTTLGILAGTLPAAGPGVRLTVESRSGTIGTDQLLNGLEELRNAGAEAIEINDSVRVVAQTGLVDSPTQGLVVGGTPVQPPYVIEVDRGPLHPGHRDGLRRRVHRRGAERRRDGQGRAARQRRDRVGHPSLRADLRQVRGAGVACGSPRLPDRTDLRRRRMPVYPEDLKYTAEHEWVRDPGEATDSVRVGITEYAQDQLGDIVFVSLPEVGTEVEAGSAVGELESTKSVSDVYVPVSGRVVARNESLDASPELVNSDPYGEGWLFEVGAGRPGGGGRSAERGRLPGAAGLSRRPAG